MDDQGTQTYNQLQQKLIAAQDDATRVVHHGRQIEQLTAKREEELVRNDELGRNFLAEEKDVEKMQKMSWKRLKAKVGEGTDEALLREQMEAQAAADLLESSNGELAYLQGEIDRYEAEVAELGDTEAKIETARVELEDFVHTNLMGIGSKLAEFDREESELHAELIEINEAIAAGTDAQAELVVLHKELRKAKNMSNFDTWGGGGFLISMRKRDHIRASTEQTRAVAHVMQRFDRELNDTHVENVELKLESALANETFDIWFDNIFTDFSVHGKIKEAIDQAKNVAMRVHESMELLRAAVEVINERLEALAAERMDLLARPQDAR